MTIDMNADGFPQPDVDGDACYLHSYSCYIYCDPDYADCQQPEGKVFKNR